MWTLYTNASKFNQRPSSYFADMVDEWVRYQFDNAVAWFGMTIENALLEREPLGDPKKNESRQKYELEDLLDDDFRMQRPPSKLEIRQQGAAKLLDLASDPRSGVRMWREKKPGED